MLIRILFFIVLIGAVVFMLRRGKQSNDSHSEQSSNTESGASKGVEAEQMVPCQHCGVHLPQTEALEDAGSFYCSQQHIDEAKRNNDGG